MPPHHKTHFCFDLDDTLTDSYQFNQQMFVETFSPYINIKRKRVEKYLRELHFTSRGTSMSLQFKEAVDHFALELNPKKLVYENEMLHVKNIEGIKIFDAVEDFIKTLKSSGRKVSLFSNRQTQSLLKILSLNNLTEHFTNIISCGDAGHDKPDPYCLKKLVKQSREPKEQFIFFGDSKTDSEFATNAGIDFIIIDHYLNQKKFYKMILQSFL